MKQSPSELAVLGAPPAFAQPLHVGRPNIGDRRRFLERISQSLEQRQLSNDGPWLQRFEEGLRARLGARHCVAVANGTLGLMMAAKALGLQGEVIMPSFTFVATAHALAWQGITPVFCEIDPVTCQIDPRAVEPLITSRTTAILGVHLFGRSCDVDALGAIARKRGLKLLIDAAHAVGCSVKGQAVARRGDLVVFSFHATKVMNSFEGGAIATDDDALAATLRRMRSFGFSDYDQVDELGINAKMNEAAAAMGLTSLESLDEFIAANRRNYNAYRKALAGVPGIRMLEIDESEQNNYHYVIVDVDGDQTGTPRDSLIAILHAENVLARRYFYPGCHRMEPYVSDPRARELRLPDTDRVAARILALPTGTAVEERDIEIIGSIIRLGMSRGREIAGRLAPIGK